MTSRFLHSATPIVAAPMAGGATTVALTAAASAAGAFGFLPAGYRSAPQLAADISELRTHTGEFGVNLFVPDRAAVDVAAFARYAASIA
ncbi:nitronate monooxygenase, partial [Leucobacter sp. BZR 635]